ncbi:unnamed protein product, partial [Arabidopsis halleri]
SPLAAPSKHAHALSKHAHALSKHAHSFSITPIEIRHGRLKFPELRWRSLDVEKIALIPICKARRDEIGILRRSRTPSKIESDPEIISFRSINFDLVNTISINAAPLTLISIEESSNHRVIHPTRRKSFKLCLRHMQ